MSAKCWCRHGAESHAERRDDREHCIVCERSGTPRYFDPVHRFQPVITLRPLPAFLFRDAGEYDGHRSAR